MAEQEKAEEKDGVTLGMDVRKADTAALITNGVDAFPPDSFAGTYWTGGGSGAVAILEPQYKPGTLYALMSQNNTLAQCVEAMEVNIDGTGHSIEKVDPSDETEDEAQKQILTDFFAEPYPGKSMTEIRRDIRRDRETTGNGYMEVIRTVAGDVVMVNWIDGTDIRLVRLDDPVWVDKTVTRAGKPVTIKVRTRERRFVQQVNGAKVYFKEFNASRDLDRTSGEWAPEGARLPVEKRASELIHFKGNKEPKTSYGSPRWISQLPSVLGSRKAEEHNLEFFDAGGLPPVLVLVQGGTLGDETKQSLRLHLSGKGDKHRAAIVEAVSTSGSLDSAGNVQIRVERFGSERQSDAMFQNYDASCEEHVRCAFRLPPLFIGKASDFNFATAYTAYMVAEAQVFYPERDEFDAVINTQIVPALGVTKYKFRSLPMTLVDVANQLKAMELVSTAQIVAGESLVKALNETTGLSLEYEEPPEPAPAPAPVGVQPGAVPPDPAAGASGAEPQLDIPANGSGLTPSVKSEVSPEVVQLAAQYSVILGFEDGPSYTHAEKSLIRKKVSELDGAEKRALDILVAMKSVAKFESKGGVAELCGCAAHSMGV